MHEIAIIYNALEIVKRHAQAHLINKVHKIVLTVGEFCALEEDCLHFAFESLSQDPLCKGARLIIEKSEAKAYCQNCENEFKISFTNKFCPICKSFSHNIIAGYEILVTSIEGVSHETNPY